MKHAQISPGVATHPRSKTPISITGCFRRVGSLPGDMEFSKLSYDGFQINTDGEIEVGEMLWVRMRGLGPTPAIIKSRQGSAYTCEFQKPISDVIAYIPEAETI